jgi:hypothetical protein
MGLGVVGVLALGTMLGLSLRSLAGTASADPAAPNPGHEWSQMENHGTSGAPIDTYWLGTAADQALELRVNGERALRLEPNDTSPNVIGGLSGNSVTGGAYGATIAGGGASGGPPPANPNGVTDDYGTIGGGGNNRAGDSAGTTDDATYATVGGGSSNTASGDSATVGGGWWNTASGGYGTVGGGSDNVAQGGYATVGGGWDNEAAAWATVGGGHSNSATAGFATVGGGEGNIAGGTAATVPGGSNNTAQGPASFAAGHRAKANHQGTFVWADSNDFDFASTADNEFSARATGGARFVSAIDLDTGAPTAGVVLNAGESAWSTLSSRDLKDNFTTVDGREVLARLAEVPVSSWNYKAQDSSIRHMGPVAQDFYAAFGLGESETAITTVDADGVALAAIQGLYQLSQEQAGRIQALETQNASLQQRLDNLEAMVSALEGGGDGEAAVSQASSSGLPTAWLLLGGGLALVLGGLVVVQRRLAGGRR